jgi:ketosteroid isomerase-like protein
MATAVMSTMEIATTLVELCNQGKNFDAMETLYADDIVSVEAGGPPGMDRVATGKPAVVAKSQWWVDNHDVHSRAVGGPWPNGDQFITTFKYDVTFKPDGRRFTMEEAALYTVRDGKIAKEEFFYTAG